MILEKKFHLFFKKSNFDGGHGLFMDRSERLRPGSVHGEVSEIQWRPGFADGEAIDAG